MFPSKPNEMFAAVDKRTNRHVRCMAETGGTVFVFGKRSRRYGWRFSESDFLDRFRVPKKTKTTTPTEQWHTRLNRAIKCLHESGLWPDYLVSFRNLLQMSAEDFKTLQDIRLHNWKLVDGVPVPRPQDEQDRLLAPYYAKYPFAILKDEAGHLDVDYRYVHEAMECKLKSMYFGSFNKDIKAELKAAIEDRRPWSCGGIRTSYDVTVEYEPGLQEGWYSEEYKGRGSGHY